MTEARDLALLMRHFGSGAAKKNPLAPNLFFVLNEEPSRPVWLRFQQAVSEGDKERIAEDDFPVYVDSADRGWFACVQDRAGPTVFSPLLSTLLDPRAVYGMFFKKREEPVSGTMGGEARYLGGLILLDGCGREVWRKKERFYGDTADIEEVEKIVKEMMAKR